NIVSKMKRLMTTLTYLRICSAGKTSSAKAAIMTMMMSCFSQPPNHSSIARDPLSERLSPLAHHNGYISRRNNDGDGEKEHESDASESGKYVNHAFADRVQALDDRTVAKRLHDGCRDIVNGRHGKNFESRKSAEHEQNNNTRQ